MIIAMLTLALMAVFAYAQDSGGAGGMGGGGRGGKGRNAAQNTEQQKADQQKKKAAEDAYKAGIKTIPDAKEKFDPWRNAR